MRLGCWLFLTLAGCGLFPGMGETTPEEETTLHVAEVAGGRVVALRRPTSGLVSVSLVVDAGSRDADPPQLALAAAWLAAERAGDGVSPRVLPDGTAFESMCDAGGLAECVARLGRALGARGASEGEVASLRIRLADARRRAAADDGRTADALALESLLGEAARGMQPFGPADADERVTAESVAGFLAAHYGPTRAMLIAAGDVSGRALEDAAAEALDTSAATARRAVRGLAAAAEVRPRVVVGDSTAVAAAALLPDLGSAAEVARAAGATPLGDAGPVVHAFEVRGGALVVARAGHGEPARAARELAYGLGVALAERAEAAQPDLDDDPVAAARGIAQRWLAEGAPAPAAHAVEAVGLGAVVAGGRGDETSDDPDRTVRERARQELVTAAEHARALVHPRTRGRVTEDAAAVVIDNGARIDVRRRAGDRRVAVAVRFAGGAGADPAALHGRAALLSVIAAESCPALGPGGIGARLGALDATLTPSVDADGFGVVADAPRERWREALDLALRCTLAAEPGRGDVERARILLLDRLEGAPVMAAWAALAIAPAAPGRVAPLGGPDTVRELSPAAVRRGRRDALAGARIAVAVVGDVPVGEAAERVARRVTRLPRGTGVPAARPVDARPEGPLARDWERERPRVVIAWAADEPRADGDAARAFAETIASSLGRAPGLEPAWFGGGASDGHAWAAVAVDATEDALAALPATIRSLSAGADVEAARRRRVRARARALASPASAAAQLARERLATGGAGEPGRTVQALSVAPPAFVIGRAN